MVLLKNQIWDLMNNPKYQPSNVTKIMQLIGSDDIHLTMKALNELEEEHKIFHNDFALFGTLKALNIYMGVLDLKEAGFGFVKSDELLDDIFVKKGHTLNAMDEDIVYVEILRPTDKHNEGRIVSVIERKHKFLIGKLKQKNGHYDLLLNNDLPVKCSINLKHAHGAINGDIVKVIITNFGDGRLVKGKVDKIIGSSNDPFMDIKAKVAEANIPVDFSSEALNEANMINPNILMDDRINLTDKMIVTIDGEDAKDFDDAISVEKIDDDTYRLGVYIADVSNYVKDGSSLDLDAYKRGFSCYLPNGVIPMLPFNLSDDLCSLKEGVNRYVLTVSMDIKDGIIIDYDIFKAVIQSKGRLTYQQVNQWFDTNTVPSNYAMLNDALSLYYILANKRAKLGVLDFNTKEAKVITNELGKAIGIEIINRSNAEKMIEEFMIATNECVAEAIGYREIPFLYRIHDEPSKEKIDELRRLMLSSNIKIPLKNNKLNSNFFKTILNKLPIESQDILNKSLIRCMAKAEYSPNNIGHFGLAINYYTHFTSPIRRYSDLIVHRLVKEYLLNERTINNKDNLLETLNQIGTKISGIERKIESLERDCLNIKKVEFIANYQGSVFEGIISSIKSWGIYVQLDNTVEGLISRDVLLNLGYTYDDKLNIWSNNYNNLYLTKKVMVKLIGTNKVKGQVDFLLKGDYHE